MKKTNSFSSRLPRTLLAGLFVASSVSLLHAAAAPAAGAYDDHQNMMDQLGITALRPGKSGSNQNGAGFDIANANPWKDTMPDPLKMKNGMMVTLPSQWPARRAEILEDFEREIYGRIPANVPKVTWTVDSTTQGMNGNIPIVTKILTGHVDNSAFPSINVNIRVGFTVPANATGPVPVIFEFGNVQAPGGGGARGGGARGAMGGGGQRAGAPRAMGAGAAGPGGGNWNSQALAIGWGYGNIDPGSIQADMGGNSLRQGIIGLTNKGEPRQPDQWGALRAWQWGVSMVIDYFQDNSDSKVDPKEVAITGVSRYGKAAIVAEAFEPRVSVALVGSSGEGGAKLNRHDFGESVENLTAGEYYWMAGNFLKYGASAPVAKTAADIPVDSHELIALCAPRPVFISYGVESAGDPKWVDAPGSYMAAILATPVYKLLGKSGIDVAPADYIAAAMPDKMPAVGQLVGGELAWRQHEGGHTQVPNFPAFFSWIPNYIKSNGPIKTVSN